jgi:superfamily II DNA helicase RecQ
MGAQRGLTRTGPSEDLDVLSTICAFEKEIDNPSSLPPTPSPLPSSIEARARGALRRLFGPEAQPKSPEQLELLEITIQNTIDAFFIIPTGGGKSAAWDGAAVAEPGFASVVMVPYSSLLDQHLQTSLGRGIIAHKYTTSSTPPEEYQILYIQPETGKTLNFKV